LRRSPVTWPASPPGSWKPLLISVGSAAYSLRRACWSFVRIHVTRVVGRPERRLARARRDVHVVEKAAAQAQLVDQRQREGVDVGDPHGAGLGVLGLVGERSYAVLGAGVEGLDPPPDPVAIGLDDGDVVACLLQQQPGGQSCNARTHDEHVAGPPGLAGRRRSGSSSTAASGPPLRDRP